MLAVAVVIAVAGALYVAARETSMFAVRDVVVTGAPKQIEDRVRAALAPLLGKSLVGLSTHRVEALVDALPTVVSASADRDYPQTLRVAVRPERPVAVVRHLQDSWLVSERGRIMGQVPLGAMQGLPRIWLGQSVTGLAPGSVLLADQGGVAVRALSALPHPFPLAVWTAGGTPDAVTVTVRGPIQLRLGEAEDLRLKLRVAAAVLHSLTAEDLASMGYLDVSLPDRPVSGLKSQVESQA